MTHMCYTDLVERPYALRFKLDTPDAVIHSVVREANDLITAQIHGLLFFPFEVTEELFGGSMVKAVHLRANTAAYSRFLERGFSSIPVLTRRCTAVVARRRRLADFDPQPMALAG